MHVRSAARLESDYLGLCVGFRISEQIFDKFDSLTPASVPMDHPVCGTTYLFEWDDDKQKFVDTSTVATSANYR